MKNKINILGYVLFLFTIISFAPKKTNTVFADGQIETITFIDANWGNKENVELIVGENGNTFYNNGVKIQKDKSGAYIKTSNIYNDIYKVSVSYCTNIDKGEGSINININDTLINSVNVDYTSGGTTSRNIEYTVDNLDGQVLLSVNCNVSSIYINSLNIYYNGSKEIAKIEEPSKDEGDNENNNEIIESLKPTYSGTYYNDVNTKQKGENLLKALGDKLNKNVKDVGYDGLKSCYQYTDTYPNTNLIWDMYSNYKFEFTTDMSKPYSKEGDMYNREHITPQSWFDKASPMRSDLFNVVPTDGYVNNIRGNYPHGDVETANTTTENGSKRGTCKNPYGSGIVFEVIDEYKGDFARSYLYMATRYYSKLSNWGSGANVVYKGTFPYLTDFAINQYVTWAIKDPVSQKEIDRNDSVEYYQKNRNPFVDNPGWVIDIWGECSSCPKVEGFSGEDINPTGPETPSVEINYGTSTNPLTVAEAINEIIKLNGNESQEKAYVKGVVTSVSDKSSHNSYNIYLEAGDKSFQIYSMVLNNNALPKVNDEIVVYGHLLTYVSGGNTIYEVGYSSINKFNPQLIKIIENTPQPPVHIHDESIGKSFEKLGTKTGLKCNFDVIDGNAKIKELILNYKINLNNELLDSLKEYDEYEYGILLLNDLSLNLKNVSNISEDLITTNKAKLLINYNNETVNEVKTSEQFNKENYQNEYKAVSYLIYDDRIYFSNSSTYSAYSLANSLAHAKQYEKTSKEFVGLNAIIGGKF